MSPTEELKHLAERKAVLRARIAERRAESVAVAQRWAKPLELADRGFTLWRQFPGRAKWLAVPAGMILVRTLGKRFGGWTGLLRYAPIAVQVAQKVAAMRRGKSAAG